MRQAGRILPQYRAVRAKVSGFIELATTPALAAEVTIQPVDLLGVDAAIIFSDILVVPEAMGLPYVMEEQKGPFFPQTIRHEGDLNKLKKSDADTDLGYVMEAIRLTKQGLQGRVPLIGFAGAPWTIFSYMTEGKGSKTFSKAKAMLYQQPQLAHQLLQRITDSTIDYLQAQIRAGVDAVQLFDSWAAVLSPEAYEAFAMPYIRQICQSITEVPLIVFAKGAVFARESLGQLPCAALGMDWTMAIEETRRLVGDDKILQGNLDPCVLYADFQTIRRETHQMLQRFGNRHIANLGHGLYPDIDPDKVRCFVDAVKEFQLTTA